MLAKRPGLMLRMSLPTSLRSLAIESWFVHKPPRSIAVRAEQLRRRRKRDAHGMRQIPMGRNSRFDEFQQDNNRRQTMHLKLIDGMK